MHTPSVLADANASAVVAFSSNNVNLVASGGHGRSLAICTAVLPFESTSAKLSMAPYSNNISTNLELLRFPPLPFAASINGVLPRLFFAQLAPGNRAASERITFKSSRLASRAACSNRAPSSSAIWLACKKIKSKFVWLAVTNVGAGEGRTEKSIRVRCR